MVLLVCLNIKSIKIQEIFNFTLLGYIFCYNEPESSHRGMSFFVSNKLKFKQWPDLVVDEEKLESTFIKLVLPNIGNVVKEHFYKHPSMKTGFFNDEYLTSLVSRINKRRKNVN